MEETVAGASSVCQQGQELVTETEIPCRECSGVRVDNDRFGVVVGEWVIATGLDDPVGNLGRGLFGGISGLRPGQGNKQNP